MARINIDKLDAAELEELRRRIDERLQNLEKERLQSALDEIQAIAKKHGIAIADVLNGTKPAKRGASGPAKYRHPENTEITWTGRGRRPDWVKEHLAANRDLNDLSVA